MAVPAREPPAGRVAVAPGVPADGAGRVGAREDRERGQGAPEAVVRGWLAKALNASRGPQWICDKCNHVHAAWVPICENCGAFDTLSWKAAPHSEDLALSRSAMLPLIMGGLDNPSPGEVEDAEVTGSAGA